MDSRTRVVALRATKTDEGYRSIHAELTRPSVGGVLRAVARTTGEVLIAVGLVVLLFAGYQVWGKVAQLHGHQNTLDSQLAQAWGSPTGAPQPSAPPPPPGDAIGRMYIPGSTCTGSWSRG